MRKQGFTLLELLIVLGLIVALIGLGIPGVFRMYARNQLKSAAQDLQGNLYRTRLDAMKSGKAIVFRYQYGTSVFEILPKEIFDLREKNQEGLGAVSVGPELLQDSLPPEQGISTNIYQRILPSQIVFGSKLQESAKEFPFEVSVESMETTSFSGNFEDVSSGTAGTTKIDGGWSPPILFYPNGRTSQTILLLRTTGRYQFQQELTLRGLTGTAKITE